jgi:phosphoglycolate phosphatase
MKYDAVIFDFDGVLMDSGFDDFHWAFEERRRVVEENGWDVNLERLGQGIFQPDTGEKIAELLDEENVSWRQLREMEEAVAERKVEMASTGEIQVFDDAKTALEELDCPKAVVSNAYNDYLRNLLEALGIEDYIDFWIAPRLSEIKRYRERMKPEPELLEEAMDQLKTRNVVMIGDQMEDVLAARNAGIDSIYIDRSGDKESKADHSVKSLVEALNIIQD